MHISSDVIINNIACLLSLNEIIALSKTNKHNNIIKYKLLLKLTKLHITKNIDLSYVIKICPNIRIVEVHEKHSLSRNDYRILNTLNIEKFTDGMSRFGVILRMPMLTYLAVYRCHIYDTTECPLLKQITYRDESSFHIARSFAFGVWDIITRQYLYNNKLPYE